MEILAQSSADFALTYNFQGTHILGASRGYLSDSVIFLLNINICRNVWQNLTRRVSERILKIVIMFVTRAA